jgi:hypothetical protein
MSQNDEQPAALEPRWPIALTVLGFITITIALRVLQPKRESVGPPWLVPALEIAMLLALLAANPAHIQERRRWLRRVAIGLIFALGAAALWSTVVLVVGLIGGSRVTQSASSLLASGALIWLGNALVFSLIYWIFDTGGPWVRYKGTRPYPDFAFTQQLSPELAPPGWRPMYVDYMVLGLNTSAFPSQISAPEASSELADCVTRPPSIRSTTSTMVDTNAATPSAKISPIATRRSHLRRSWM